MDWHEAKTACADLFLNGFSDWHLPTKEELNMLYWKRPIRDFRSGIYWSSTSYSSHSAWGQRFGGIPRVDGLQVRHSIIYKERFRCVRDF